VSISLHKNNFITQVWCVDGNAKTAVVKEDIGKFYSGDCYIILYTYHSGDKREEYYLSYWIGKNSLAVIILCMLRHLSMVKQFCTLLAFLLPCIF
jgi:hypothetical protein